MSRQQTSPNRAKYTGIHDPALAVLEAHLHRELDVPPIPSSREGGRGRADNSIPVRGVINEVGAVQDVEKFGPELQISGLTQKRQRSILVQREVPVEQAGAGEYTPAHVAEVTRDGRGEHIGIEPPIRVASDDRGSTVNNRVRIALPPQRG